MASISKLKSIVLIAFAALAITSCSNDDDCCGIEQPFVVAFETPSGNLQNIENSQEIPLVYSETSTVSGTITITIASNNAIYGTDYTTTPVMDGNTITVPISQGEISNGVTFNKLNPNLDETAEITFTILAIDYPDSNIQGYSSYTLNNSASLGRSFAPTVGGPNQPNQVYIDLSNEKETLVKRDAWDLGFYSGPEFRVGINGSIYMAAGQLDATNIDAISSADVADFQDDVAVGTFDPANEAYIDHPDGDILKTAIDVVSPNDAQNKVYLLNLGFEVGTETPAPGGVAIAGDARGWKKIRILQDGNGYLLQYANLDDTSHQEISIPKNSDFNFTFFSFNTENTVTVEPAAESWDICFTVFTNIIEGAGSYGFSDGVLHNRKGGVRAYRVFTEDVAYDDFGLAQVDRSQFDFDQRTIGSSWREVISEEKILVDTIYYIIEDPNGNLYKLKFTALLNDNGVRGYPEFKYELLQ